MNTLDEKIGYLIAKSEEQGNDLKGVIAKVENLEAMVKEKFTTVETLLNVSKFMGLVIIAVLTFKFGDVVVLWDKFFG